MTVQLMGIVNLNPDSFSTGATTDPLGRALALVEAGADIVDLGAQSASPSTPVVEPGREIAMLVPIVAELADRGVRTSVDTYKPAVARAAMEAGAGIINDYSGTRTREMVDVVASGGAELVLTHNIGRVKQRLTDPTLYENVVAEVGDWFDHRLSEMARWGLQPEQIVLDPGIDLSKTPAQTVEVLRGLGDLRERFTNRFLVAISRKDFIGTISPCPPEARDPGTLAALATLMDVPDVTARVHDVAGARQFLDVALHLRGLRDLPHDAELAPAHYRSSDPDR